MVDGRHGLGEDGGHGVAGYGCVWRIIERQGAGNVRRRWRERLSEALGWAVMVGSDSGGGQGTWKGVGLGGQMTRNIDTKYPTLLSSTTCVIRLDGPPW